MEKEMIARKEKKPLKLWWRIFLILFGIICGSFSLYLIFTKESTSTYPWYIFLASLSLSAFIYGIYLCIVYYLRYRWDNHPPTSRGKMLCIEDRRVRKKTNKFVSENLKDLIWKGVGLSTMYILFLLYFIKDPFWAIVLIPFLGMVFIGTMLLLNYNLSLRRSQGNIFYSEGIMIHSGFTGKRFVKYTEISSLRAPKGSEKYLTIILLDKSKLQLPKNRKETKEIIQKIQQKLEARKKMGTVMKKVVVK